VTCRNCGLEVPSGQFCTRCGAHQGIGGDAGARRGHRFAANPDEAVDYPGLFSSLFPHLDSRQLNSYRLAFVVGLGIVVGLFMLGLATSAFLAAATVLPVLAVVFVLEQRPVRAELPRLLGTMVAAPLALGAFVGLLVSIVSAGISPFRGDGGLDPGGLITFALAIPLAVEAIKAALALSLRKRPYLGETIDGVVIGSVVGLFFTYGAALILFARIVPTVDVVVDDTRWLFPIISAGILGPILHAASTAAISASLWRGYRGDISPALAVVLALGGHVTFVIGTAVVLSSGRSPLVVLIWQAVVVAAELILVRRLVHRSLMEEAAAVPLAPTTCPNCRLAVDAASFCPNCGLAMVAVPDSFGTERAPVTEGASSG